MFDAFVKRLKNPFFYTALTGLIYLVMSDVGLSIGEAHFAEYVSVIAVLIGVVVDPSTSGLLDKKE